MMSTTHTRSVTAAVGAAIAGAVAPALLFLGAGTAHAVQDVSERGAIAIIKNLPTPRDCGSCGGFNPQPDPPGYSDPSSRSPLIGNPNEAGVGNPNDAGVGNPDEAGIGNPDTAGVGNPNEAGVGNPNDVGLGGPDTGPSPSQARTGQ
jgi:hypothetical protein